MLRLLQELHQLVHVLQFGQVAWAHRVDDGIQGVGGLVDLLLAVCLVGGIHVGDGFLVLCRHAGEAVLGPGCILRHLHREGVPGLLLLAAALGDQEQFAQLRLVDFVRDSQFGVGIGLHVHAEVVGHVLVARIVGEEGAAAVGQRIEVGVGPCPLLGAAECDVAEVRLQVDGGLVPVLDACRGHHQRTVHEGACPHRGVFRLGTLPVGGSGLHLVGAEVEVLGEGHHHLYHVSLLPLAGGNLHITAGLIGLGDRLAVEFHVEALRSPVGHAQLHGEFGGGWSVEGRVRIEDADGGFLCWPLALLLQRDALLLPAGGGRQVETDPDGVVVDEVGCLLVLHVVLHARAAAAGGLRGLVAPGLRGVEAHGILIDGLILLRIHRADDLVVEHPLVVVHIAGIVGVETVQVFRQFCQVVGAAGLVDGRLWVQFAPSPTGHVVQHRGDLRVGLTEHLTVAHAAHRIAVAALYHRPEVLGEVIVIRIVVAAEGSQGARHHRDMLVGMAGADGVDVPGQGVEEGGAVEAGGCLQQVGLLLGIARHLREPCQRLCHAAHLAGDVHVPHLVAVAGLGAALVLTAVALHVGTVVQAVPHPQSHVLGDEQGLLGRGLVVDIGGDVDETCQLLVYRVIGSPHPTLIVVGAVHLYQGAVLGGDGVQVAVAILLIVFLIAVEVGPGALHLLQFLLRGEVAGLPVAAQLLVPYEGALLALAQAVDHLYDVTLEDGLLLRILTTGKGEGHRRHVVARAVTLQFGRRRVPAVGLGIALRRESVGVAVVIELLLHGQADQLVDVEVAVPGQTVVAVDAHLVEGQRLGHGDVRRHSPGRLHDLHLRRDGVAVRRTVVAEDHPAYLIYSTYRIDGGVGLSLLRRLRGVEPLHLTVFPLAV